VGFGFTLSAILVATLATFALGFLATPWLAVLVVLDLISLAVVVDDRTRLSVRLVMVAVAAAGLCLVLSAATDRLDIYQGFYLASVALLFTGGGLLLERSGLARLYLVSGQIGAALRAFFTGCLLAVPAALLNVSHGAHRGDGWVDRFWEPAMALVPGIAEESWARLFLLTLLFVLVQPTTAQRPKRALAVAVAQAVVTAAIFGLPMGLLFVRHGFEAAVGYHFFVDFVRFLVAFWQGG
jgi:hypothetical protein